MNLHNRFAFCYLKSIVKKTSFPKQVDGSFGPQKFSGLFEKRTPVCKEQVNQKLFHPLPSFSSSVNRSKESSSS